MPPLRSARFSGAVVLPATSFPLPLVLPALSPAPGPRRSLTFLPRTVTLVSVVLSVSPLSALPSRGVPPLPHSNRHPLLLPPSPPCFSQQPLPVHATSLPVRRTAAAPPSRHHFSHLSTGASPLPAASIASPRRLGQLALTPPRSPRHCARAAKRHAFSTLPGRPVTSRPRLRLDARRAWQVTREARGEATPREARGDDGPAPRFRR